MVRNPLLEKGHLSAYDYCMNFESVRGVEVAGTEKVLERWMAPGKSHWLSLRDSDPSYQSSREKEAVPLVGRDSLELWNLLLAYMNKNKPGLFDWELFQLQYQC